MELLQNFSWNVVKCFLVVKTQEEVRLALRLTFASVLT